MATGTLLAAALLVPTTSASAATQPAASEITLDLVAVLGTGCPAGTAATSISPDAKAFTVIYSEYTAMTQQANQQVEKACQIAMRVKVPPAFTYAIASVDYRGYKYLTGNSRAEMAGIYYFQGNQITQYQNHAINAGTGEWQITDSVPFTTQVYKPCGEDRNFNIKTRLTTWQQNATGQNYVTMDSTDAEFATIYHFSWMTC
jgi:hypothetical protein